MKTNSGVFRTLGFWFYDELRGRIGNQNKKISLETPHGIFEVGSKSKRLKCFKKTPRCAYCHRVGSIWMLQSAGCMNWHLNLYALDKGDDFVLMNRDHVVPLARGGTDALNNSVTSCEICNGRKGCNSIILLPNILM